MCGLHDNLSAMRAAKQICGEIAARLLVCTFRCRAGLEIMLVLAPVDFAGARQPHAWRGASMEETNCFSKN